MNCKLSGSEKTETITKESEMVNFLRGGESVNSIYMM